MKAYGNLINRIMEAGKPSDDIHVGMGVTECMWSDRKPYEVVKVVDQSHVFIREMKAIRTDHNGMSECQDYRYESQPDYKSIEVKLFKHGWWSVEANASGRLVKQSDMHLAFGVMEKYYDFSF